MPPGYLARTKQCETATIHDSSFCRKQTHMILRLYIGEACTTSQSRELDGDHGVGATVVVRTLGIGIDYVGRGAAHSDVRQCRICILALVMAAPYRVRADIECFRPPTHEDLGSGVTTLILMAYIQWAVAIGRPGDNHARNDSPRLT